MRSITFQRFLVERGTPSLNSQDQSPLSPNGRISASRRARLHRQEATRLSALGQAQREYGQLIDAGTINDTSGQYTARPAIADSAGREVYLVRRIATLMKFGIGKSGKLRPSYQREINSAQAELEDGPTQTERAAR